MQLNLFPLCSWILCDDAESDRYLVEWGHFLGPCDRPFGKQSFALVLYDMVVAVAVSASTVSAYCGGYRRGECVELARLCTRPNYSDLTRVALRLWRVTAPGQWLAYMNAPERIQERGWFWQVKTLVSYANATKHSGNLYRFDGWIKVADVEGSTGGGTWSKKKKSEPKSLWVFLLETSGCS